MKSNNPVPKQITFGKIEQFKQLAVLPILHEDMVSSFSYLTLDEALSQSLIKITETSDSGNVPELLLENSADKPILLIDGEELVGAKQNRILNLTILAPPKQKIVIPVSCVEAGRWVYDRNDFINSDRAHFAKGRAKKMASVSESMHANGSKRSNQGEVWADIDDKFTRMHTSSETSAMSEIFNHSKVNLDEYVKAFGYEEKQVGAFFYINGRLIGFDLFDQAYTYSRLCKKLFRSYAIDALEQTETDSFQADIMQAKRMIESLHVNDWKSYSASGMGTDLRINLTDVISAGLTVDDTTIHLSGFVIQSDEVNNEQHSNMSSSRMRRRNIYF